MSDLTNRERNLAVILQCGNPHLLLKVLKGEDLGEDDRIIGHLVIVIRHQGHLYYRGYFPRLNAPGIREALEGLRLSPDQKEALKDSKKRQEIQRQLRGNLKAFLNNLKNGVDALIRDEQEQVNPGTVQ